jgi:hypothetical protein
MSTVFGGRSQALFSLFDSRGVRENIAAAVTSLIFHPTRKSGGRIAPQRF